MNCPKCKGFMAEYMAYDGAMTIPMLRCVNCGLVTDEIVEANRGIVLSSQKGRGTNHSKH